MSQKKKFLIRIDNRVFASLEKWAADELRSINAQIEYILTDSLKKANRLQEIKNQPVSNVDTQNERR